MTNLKRIESQALDRVELTADDIDDDSIEQYMEDAIETIEKWLKRNKGGKLKLVGGIESIRGDWVQVITFRVQNMFTLICEGDVTIEEGGECNVFLRVFTGLVKDNERKDDDYIMTIDLDKKKVTDIIEV